MNFDKPILQQMSHLNFENPSNLYSVCGFYHQSSQKVLHSSSTKIHSIFHNLSNDGNSIDWESEEINIFPDQKNDG